MYINSKNLIGKRCLDASFRGGSRVKGKQVKILCDLVTVQEERAAKMSLTLVGKAAARVDAKPGNLPFAGTEIRLGFQTTRYWLYVFKLRFRSGFCLLYPFLRGLKGYFFIQISTSEIKFWRN